MTGHGRRSARLDEVTARKAGLDAISTRRPDVAGFRIVASRYARGIIKATTTTGFAFEQADPGDFWLIEFNAPAQQGFEHVVAVAIVDDTTGTVVANSVGAYND